MSAEAEILITGLAIAPVKGTRLRSRRQVHLGRAGVRENRRFYVIDDGDRMLNGKELGELSSVIADYCDARRTLKLTFPNGLEVEGDLQPGGPAVTTRFFSRSACARLVAGPWSDALSSHADQRLRLVEAGDEAGAVDRGARGAVSLISGASLARLALAGGEPDVDPRRFRMLIEVGGLDAHAEDDWVGGAVRIGATAVVAWGGHVGRCVVTRRDPDSGMIDLATLDILRGYRGGLETTEPLAFGIYGEVVAEGVIAVGDPVAPPRAVGDPVAPA
ncbi:MAG: MOSC domain-containing protein [Solirubrobacteraceae bacterium]